MNSTTYTHRTTVPIIPTVTFAHSSHILHAREVTSESVNLITITTSLAAVVIAIIGLILGYIYWKHPRVKPSPILSRSNFSVNDLYALFRLLQRMALVTLTPTPPEHQSDLELGRVTPNPEPDITVEPELANT